MCDGCKKGDCGKCKFCLDMPRFGGPGKKKRRCENCKCTGTHNMLTCTIVYQKFTVNYVMTFTHRNTAVWRSTVSWTIPCNPYSRCITRVLPDGNCLFRALSQQLSHFEELHQTLRELLVKFLLQPWQFSLQGNIWNNGVTSSEHAEKCLVGYTSRNPGSSFTVSSANICCY